MAKWSVITNGSLASMYTNRNLVSIFDGLLDEMTKVGSLYDRFERRLKSNPTKSGKALLEKSKRISKVLP